MTDKVYGFTSSGQHLTGNLNTYIVRTLLDITATGSASYTPGSAPNYQDTRVVDSQFRLDSLVQVISGRGQPVIMGNIVTTTETTPADLPAASGSVTVYNLVFSIEHNQSWEVAGNNPDLAESLDGVVGFVFTTPTTNNNVSVSLVSPTLAGTVLAAALAFPTDKIV
jgi:hypothetical protein